MCMHIYLVKNLKIWHTHALLHTILVSAPQPVNTHDTQVMHFTSSHLVYHTTCVVYRYSRYSTNDSQLKRHKRVQKQKVCVASNHQCSISDLLSTKFRTWNVTLQQTDRFSSSFQHPHCLSFIYHVLSFRFDSVTCF